MEKIKSITETFLLFVLTTPFVVIGFIAGSIVRMSMGGYEMGYNFWNNTYKTVAQDFYFHLGLMKRKNASKNTE